MSDYIERLERDRRSKLIGCAYYVSIGVVIIVTLALAAWAADVYRQDTVLGVGAFIIALVVVCALFWFLMRGNDRTQAQRENEIHAEWYADELRKWRRDNPHNS